MSPRDTLVALGASLLAAGLLARLGRSIGLPTIPLFMIAGLLFGPNTPGIQLVDDPSDFALLATLGLILLLFYLGLEFSLGELTSGGRRLATAGSIYLGLNIGAGIAFGFALGWGSREALVIAGAVGISSSAIVTKILVEMRRLTNRETRLILGIVVVEDLFLAVYLAALQPVLDESAGAVDALLSFSKAFGFLVVVALIARYGSSVVGRVIGAEQDELLTVCFVGLAVLVAGIAEELHVSDAIGAFMAGLVVAETTVAPRVRKLVLPLRDTFAALFFFTFGLTVDPGDVASVAGPIAIAIAVTVVVNFVAAVLVSRREHLDRTQTTNLATTILARGEFSLIIAALGAEAGLDPRVVPFVAGYVLVLALGAPILAAQSARVSRCVPRRLVARGGLVARSRRCSRRMVALPVARPQRLVDHRRRRDQPSEQVGPQQQRECEADGAIRVGLVLDLPGDPIHRDEMQHLEPEAEEDCAREQRSPRHVGRVRHVPRHEQPHRDRQQDPQE